MPRCGPRGAQVSAFEVSNDAASTVPSRFSAATEVAPSHLSFSLFTPQFQITFGGMICRLYFWDPGNLASHSSLAKRISFGIFLRFGP